MDRRFAAKHLKYILKSHSTTCFDLSEEIWDLVTGQRWGLESMRELEGEGHSATWGKGPEGEGRGTLPPGGRGWKEEDGEFFRRGTSTEIEGKVFFLLRRLRAFCVLDCIASKSLFDTRLKATHNIIEWSFVSLSFDEDELGALPLVITAELEGGKMRSCPPPPDLLITTLDEPEPADSDRETQCNSCHLLEPPCHLCNPGDKAHDGRRLTIYSGGLVRSRDVGRGPDVPYINLPSPSVPSDGAEGEEGFRRRVEEEGGGGGGGGGKGGEGCIGERDEEGDETIEEMPSPSALTSRRRALLPPKFPPDGEGDEESGDKERSSRGESVDPRDSASVTPKGIGRTEVQVENGIPIGWRNSSPAFQSPSLFIRCIHSRHDASFEYQRPVVPAAAGIIPNTLLSSGSGDSLTTSRHRSNSIVVIPPMQICPGDLLVYSKLLTQKKSLLASAVRDLEGSTTSLNMADPDGVGKGKQKNTWSLLKLFERHHRAKATSFGGLEEFLALLKPTEFADANLSKYRGLTWHDFVHSIHGSSCLLPPPPPVQPQLQPPSQVELPESSKQIASVPEEKERSPSPRKSYPRHEQPRKTLLRQRSFGSLRLKRHEKMLERKESVQNLFLNIPERPGGRTEPTIAEQPSTNGTETTTVTGDSTGAESSTAPEPTASPEDPALKNEQKRRDAMWDLFQSELAFLYDHLLVMKNVFMEPLKKIQVEGFAMFAEPELLFGNLDELCCVTYGFCKEFLAALKENISRSGDVRVGDVLGSLFIKGGKALLVSGAYHRYTLNYINALNYLETLRKQNEFNEFEKWCNKDRRCKKLQLTDLLVAPVQHITKLPLILKELESCTENASEKAIVLEILEKQEASLRELDDKMNWLKNFERLLEIQRNIVWPTVMDLDPKAFIPDFLKSTLNKQPCERLIVSPRRQILLEGPLMLLDFGKPQEMYVLLFDDMLIITRRKKGLHKKKSSITENWASSCRTIPTSGDTMRYVVHRQPLSLDRFVVHDVPSLELPNSFAVVALNRFQQIIAVHTLQASTEQLKSQWLGKLGEAQTRWKRTLQTTVFRNHRISNAGEEIRDVK
ncbi:unnamed protein product [Darwinula stevensoni]|uniref:DH domain-containing protein n=1 Tax=Darwinula stevensoni TaxID=69355 RepID=A0A7R8XF38_9CRUS|nr:unnamed protein product [Darwinula stevensoni]CAG0890316.1 unnamed protein product [Darwinula stevensoni]